MNHKEMTDIVEDSFKVMNTLSRKILKEFKADDINYFRMEVKKLRAFLRMAHVYDKDYKSVIPTLLKTFYGYIGIVRNIQLQKHRIFKYTAICKIEPPQEYSDILDQEKRYWQNNAVNLMKYNNFDAVKKEIIKQLPDKIDKKQVEKFIQSKLNTLTTSINDMEDDTELHITRKILNDLLYTRGYLKDKSILPKAISNEEELKSITEISGRFRDLCIELRFMQSGYLDQIRDENEKIVLSGLYITLQREKEHITRKALNKMRALYNKLDHSKIILNL